MRAFININDLGNILKYQQTNGEVKIITTDKMTKEDYVLVDFLGHNKDKIIETLGEGCLYDFIIIMNENTIITSGDVAYCGSKIEDMERFVNLLKPLNIGFYFIHRDDYNKIKFKDKNSYFNMPAIEYDYVYTFISNDILPLKDIKYPFIMNNKIYNVKNQKEYERMEELKEGF